MYNVTMQRVRVTFWTNTYIYGLNSNEMHMDFLCILYFIILALHVSCAIYTHHQENKLQSTAVETRNC
jgi:hypothetical protein